MSNDERLSEPDPDQSDRPYNQLHPAVRLVVHLVATGDLDPSQVVTTGDGSTLPQKLRQAMQELLHGDGNNGSTPPPESPQ